jgi:hypothetical protein
MLKWSWGWWQDALLSFNALRYSFEPVHAFLLWFVSLLYLLLIQNWHDWYVPELSQSSASQHHGWVSLPIASRNVTESQVTDFVYWHAWNFWARYYMPIYLTHNQELKKWFGSHGSLHGTAIRNGHGLTFCEQHSQGYDCSHHHCIALTVVENMLCTVRDLFSCDISLCTSLCGEASHCLLDEDAVM